MEKIKNKYYDYSRNQIEQEEFVSELKKKLKNSYNKNLHSEFETAQDLLLKYKCQSENYSLLYNYEISKINRNFQENEDFYKELYNKIKINEESRIYFIKSNMGKFSKIFEDFSIQTFDFLNVYFF